MDVASAGDQLDIVLPADIYLKRSDFSIPDIIDYWDNWAAASLGGGGFPRSPLVCQSAVMDALDGATEGETGLREQLASFRPLRLLLVRPARSTLAVRFLLPGRGRTTQPRLRMGTHGPQQR
ncbi:MAG: hypothetical protein ACRDS9_23505 [Pseudonocardiaceae bacterium]